MIEYDQTESPRGFRLVLSPNCSISWREVIIFYAITCVLALAIGLFFAFQGMWLVLPFSGLEMLALGTGLYFVSRNAHRREVISLNEQRVTVAKGITKIDHQWEFKTHWTRLQVQEKEGLHRDKRLSLGSHGEYVEVGEFLSKNEKDDLAFRLKDCIIRL